MQPHALQGDDATCTRGAHCPGGQDNAIALLVAETVELDAMLGNLGAERATSHSGALLGPDVVERNLFLSVVAQGGEVKVDVLTKRERLSL